MAAIRGHHRSGFRFRSRVSGGPRVRRDGRVADRLLRPGRAHLVPHATQSFLSALATHKRVFGYVPNDGVNVLLQDLQRPRQCNCDTGAPQSDLLRRRPLERPLRNHLHRGPVRSHCGARAHACRHHGSRQPEPIRATGTSFTARWTSTPRTRKPCSTNYLTVPRGTTPRWYQEGSAVFMETWLSGGVGRAQGGYDEMVFRAMVQDGASSTTRWDSSPRAPRSTSRPGANAYLYGTRFMDYLALTYGPQRLLDWWRRDADSRRYYADDFERVFGLPLDESWHQWIDWEHEFQQQEPAGGARAPAHRTITTSPTRTSARSRAAICRRTAPRCTRPCKYPGQRRAPRVDLAAARQRDRARRRSRARAAIR